MQALAPLWERLRDVEGLPLRLIPLENVFFGPSITVSGLLTGKCLIEGLGKQELPKGSSVYLPDIMLKDRADLFLDGQTVADVSEQLGLRLVFLPIQGAEMLEALFADLKTRD